MDRELLIEIGVEEIPASWLPGLTALVGTKLEARLNELRENWSVRVAEARQLFGIVDDERARMYLLNGAPAVRQVDTCGILLWPTEVWIYPRTERVKEVLILVFTQRGSLGPWRLWNPQEGLASLFQAPAPGAGVEALLQDLASACIRSDQIRGAIASILRRGTFDYQTLLARAQDPIEGPAREWVSTFNSYSTDLPTDAPRLPARA